jgi:hypothetical protein
LRSVDPLGRYPLAKATQVVDADDPAVEAMKKGFVLQGWRKSTDSRMEQ